MYKTSARIEASLKDDLGRLNLWLPLPPRNPITMDQQEGPGFRLTLKQDTQLLKGMIKKYGNPKVWRSQGTDVLRVWEIDGTDVAVVYRSDARPALVYIA